MPFYRVSFNFAELGFGWSEAWYTRAQVSEASMGQLARTYVDYRLQMLRNFAHFTGARLAEVPNSVTILPGIRSSRLLIPGDNKYPTQDDKLVMPEFGTYVKETDSEGMEQLRSNLQLRLAWGTTSTTRYLVGVPDALSVTETGTVDFGKAPIWGGKYIQWANFVKANFAIAARSSLTDDPLFAVRGVAKDTSTPSKLIIVFQALSNPGWEVGQLIQLSGMRLKKDQPKVSINGRYHLDKFDANVPASTFYSATLREATGVDPSVIKVFGTIRRIVKVRTSLTIIDGFRLGIHKRGRPSLTPRGRRLSRVSLDP